jgi:hypothetical protein
VAENACSARRTDDALAAPPEPLYWGPAWCVCASSCDCSLTPTPSPWRLPHMKTPTTRECASFCGSMSRAGGRMDELFDFFLRLRFAVYAICVVCFIGVVLTFAQVPVTSARRTRLTPRLAV